MRALVELYHSSGAFITEQTLDKAIEDAFMRTPDYLSKIAEKDMDVHDMRRIGRDRQNLSKIGMEDNADSKTRFSTQSDRQKRVREALFGVYKEEPGYDALLEEGDRVLRQRKEDERVLQERKEEEEKKARRKTKS
ncbi:hypothetical protein EIP91_011106 [Steccherinum ochraceum]|uniref:Uncharacterized protein n=1 Tax=Steccherinum ochraceum TaxID=92696 RepID=A0A4R0RWR6_9APHY|nr:hypothetical protein EIP91_011106 [Steccherinum ochraceum]